MTASSRWKGIAGRLALLVGSLVVGLLLAEGAAEIWLHEIASREQFLQYASPEAAQARAAAEEHPVSRYSPHRYLGFLPTPNYREEEERHDSLGFRGDPFPVRKPPGGYRIFCLGGSTTYTSMVSRPDDAYPTLLERELRSMGYGQVRVINAGAAGYTTYESLINFQFRIADLEPDLLVVYHGVNDTIARMIWPETAYRGDNSGHIGPGGGWFTSTPLLQRPALARIILLRLKRIPSAADLFSQFGSLPDSARFWLFAAQQQAGTYPDGLFRTISAERIIEKNPPIYFRRNLEWLIDAARKSGVDVVLATFAVSREKGDLFSAPAMLKGIEEQNRVLQALGDDLDVPVFDYAAVAPTAPELYFDGVHVLAEGSRIKARLFADYLARNVLPPPRPSPETRFEASDATVIDLRPGAGLEEVELMGATVLTPDPATRSVLLSAADTDPRLLLPPLQAPDGTRLILRVDVEAPADTELQLFFPAPEGPSYVEELSARLAVHRGWNVIYAALEASEIDGPIRLDPGWAEGEYRIRRIAARAVPLE
jgi:lysophospholipase L1-like esterase